MSRILQNSMRWVALNRPGSLTPQKANRSSETDSYQASRLQAQAPAMARVVPEPVRKARALVGVGLALALMGPLGIGAAAAMTPLPVSPPAPAVVVDLQAHPLRLGMHSDSVAKLQQSLQLPANGLFDSNTDQAVRDFQSKHGLQADGVVGNITFGALYSDSYWHKGTRPDLGGTRLPKEGLEVVVDLSDQQAEVRDTRSGEVLRKYPVSTGSAEFATPTGSYQVTDRYLKPEWIPPNSDWAKGSSVVAPGPNNPLGVAALQLSHSTLLLHSVPTSRFDTLGKTPASHGCIRMFPHHVMELYGSLPQGASVRVVP